MTIELGIKSPKTASVRIYYRHVSQAERFVSVAMARNGGRCQATIPAVYTDSPHPLQYYFELRTASGEACLYPGFAKDLDNQPYFVIRPEAPRS
jgi:hypothetical protein